MRLAHTGLMLEAMMKAMRAACNDAFAFTDSLTEEIAAEYLLTVHVARSINELNRTSATSYEIRIECPTRKFATECVPLMKKVPDANFTGYRSILRGRLNTLRNGRIDVAVYDGRAPLPSPVCAIELKGFNPSNSTVLTDLRRNAELFSLTAPTGDSTLPLAVFGALHSVRKLGQIDREGENLRSVEDRYRGLLAQVGHRERYLADVKSFSVRHQSERDGIDADGSPDFASDDNHHFIGALVVFEAKSATGPDDAATGVKPS
jgi:hypothetical protein